MNRAPAIGGDFDQSGMAGAVEINRHSGVNLALALRPAPAPAYGRRFGVVVRIFVRDGGDIGRSVVLDHLDGGSGFAGHPLWVAAYSEAAEPPVPAAWSKATIWQWSDTGSIAGISGDVDHDRFIGTLEELRAFTLP